MLFVGPPGVGKSNLAQAIGNEALKAGFTVLCRSIFDLVRELRDEDALPPDKLLPRYLKPDLLIVDDMGLKKLPPRPGEYLFEIVMRRYENRLTLMTSNRPVEEWSKLVGDVPAATAFSTASCTSPRSSRSPAATTGSRTAQPAKQTWTTDRKSWCQSHTKSGWFLTAPEWLVLKCPVTVHSER